MLYKKQYKVGVNAVLCHKNSGSKF